MNDRFDDIASDYNAWLAIDPDYETHHQLVMALLQNELMNAQEGKIHVLEVGCGTGYTSQRILDANPQVKLWALDASVEMVRMARAALQHNDPFRCVVVQDDVLDWRVRKTFSVVVSVFMLHNIKPEMRSVAVRNMAAALRPGGLLIIGDKISHDDAEEHMRVMKRFWTMEAKLKEFGAVGRYDYWHQHNTEDDQMKMTEIELATHLRQAGLGGIDIGQRCGIGMYAIAMARKP